MAEAVTVPQTSPLEETCHECGGNFLFEETYCGICGRPVHEFCGCREHGTQRIRHERSVNVFAVDTVEEDDGPCFICGDPVLPHHNFSRGRVPAIHDSCLEAQDVDDIMTACNAADDIEVRLDEDSEQAAFEDSEIEEVEKVLNLITRIGKPNRPKNRDKMGRCHIRDDSLFFA